MQSKRDQVQAHLFLMGRLTSGLLRAAPDAPESPQGRTNRGVVIGVVLTILISGGAFVFGLFSPAGTTSWQTAGGLIIDKQTGTRYFYLDRTLRPVRNWASARLIGGADLATSSVRTASLDGTAHGGPVGIPGAPDALPAVAHLVDDPWQVCAGGTVSGAARMAGARTQLTLGALDTTRARPLTSDEALLVTGPGPQPYLLWKGIRLRVGTAAAASLGYGSATARKVSAAFLNALPAGPDLVPRAVPGAGAEGPDLGGVRTRIGQVFRISVPGSSTVYHLLTREGLLPLTATEAALQLGAPDTRERAYGGNPVAAAELGSDVLAGHQARRPTKEQPDLPASPPRLVVPSSDEAACVAVRSEVKGVGFSLSIVPDSGRGGVSGVPGEQILDACTPVEAVSVRPGTGALVEAAAAGGANGGDTRYLITDAGVKYRLPTDADTEALGYAGAPVRRVPFLLLDMLPTGPDLSVRAASSGVAAHSTGAACALSAARQERSGGSEGGNK